jgi:hypothetical protein
VRLQAAGTHAVMFLQAAMHCTNPASPAPP